MKYTVARHTFTREGDDKVLTLRPGKTIVSVVDKFYADGEITLIFLIQEA